MTLKKVKQAYERLFGFTSIQLNLETESNERKLCDPATKNLIVPQKVEHKKLSPDEQRKLVFNLGYQTYTDKKRARTQRVRDEFLRLLAESEGQIKED